MAVDTGMSIDSAYRARFAGSAVFWERARAVSPSGVHHDLRRIVPFPVYVDHASGCRKWDVDGNEFVDLCCGHGALMLGHSHPAIVKALQDQAGQVTNASAPTPLEIEWAENIVRMVPSAEMVRFVLSGTEATMLAMRVARGHTGRDVIVRIHGHFHGWHDYGMIGYLPPYDEPFTSGVPRALASTMRAVPLNDLAAMEDALRPRDVAAVILEADGPVGGTVPVPPGYLEAVRDLTRAYGTLLIFDEVVTGFRMAPGGAQEYYGVTPDLASFAKAICAGVPSGAVAGRADVMSDITFRDDAEWNRHGRVRHMGTYSGNPLSAAVGVVATQLLADGSVQDRAADMADRLRLGLNLVMKEAGVRGCAYGTRSSVRIVNGDDLPPLHDPVEFTDAVETARLLEGTRQPLLRLMQGAQMVEGLDILGGNHAWTSGVMTEADVDEAVAMYARAVHRVVREGGLSGG